MAQWLGQFTGNTHASRVVDREAVLRAAVARCSENSSEEDFLPDLETLAHRVMEARHRSVKARLSSLREPSTTAVSQPKIERLESRMEELESGGIVAILREFHCPPHILDSMMSSGEPG